MQHPNVQAVVETAIRKLGLEMAHIAPTQHLIMDLGIDSTELAELATNIRAELGLHTQRIHLAKVNTVGDLVQQVEGLLSASAPVSAAQ